MDKPSKSSSDLASCLEQTMYIINDDGGQNACAPVNDDGEQNACAPVNDDGGQNACAPVNDDGEQNACAPVNDDDEQKAFAPMKKIKILFEWEIFPNKDIKKKETEVKPVPYSNLCNPYSLAKMAYMQCCGLEKCRYDGWETPHINMKRCCTTSMEEQTLYDAIKNNHFECFKICSKQLKKSYDQMIYIDILHKGNLNILKFAHENGLKFRFEDACENAVIGGNVECLKYVVNHGAKITRSSFRQSLKVGNLECLKYHLDNGCIWSLGSCVLSATAGDLNFVKECQKLNCPWEVQFKREWYHIYKQIIGLHDRMRYETINDAKKLQTQIDNIKICVKYISSTAHVMNKCEFNEEILDDFLRHQQRVLNAQ